MATSTIIGVFEDEAAAGAALEDLLRAGFRQAQLGVLVHGDHSVEGPLTSAPEHGAHRGLGPLARGLIGGILGAIDVLLLPITGPADASLILESTLPVVEEALDLLPYPGSQYDEAAHTRPDAPMTVRDKVVGEQATTRRTTEEAVELPTVEEAETDSDAANAADTKEERGSVVTGSIVGGLLGAAAAFFIPGIGPAIAGGILASVFGGAAMGSVAGGFLGAFTHMGVSEEKARYYVEEFKAGRTIITVQTDHDAQEAIYILRRHGAHDVQAHN